MALTSDQQAVRNQLNAFRAALPDSSTDINSLLLLSIWDELRLMRSAIAEFLPQEDQLIDRIKNAKADRDES